MNSVVLNTVPFTISSALVLILGNKNAEISIFWGICDYYVNFNANIWIKSFWQSSCRFVDKNGERFFLLKQTCKIEFYAFQSFRLINKESSNLFNKILGGNLWKFLWHWQETNWIIIEDKVFFQLPYFPFLILTTFDHIF